jgi:hypothetical protein
MPSSKTTFHCDICKQPFTSFEAAERCENRAPTDFEEPLELGDRVLCGSQGWWEGDEAWCLRVEGEHYLAHKNIPMIRSIWVVVDTWMDFSWGDHMRRYILWTDTRREGDPALATTCRRHISAKKIDNVGPENLALYQAKANNFLQENYRGFKSRLPLVS